MSNNLFDNADLKYYKPIAPCKRFKFYFKMLDMYALPITLRYKNQRKFYTNFGAGTSLFIYIIILSLMSGYFRLMFSKDPDAINSQESSQISRLLTEPEPGDLVTHFFLGFRLVDSSTGLTFMGSESTIKATMTHST